MTLHLLTGFSGFGRRLAAALLERDRDAEIAHGIRLRRPDRDRPAAAQPGATGVAA